MIINNAPQNEAILSNVGQIGEFRIRNSAKAFSILSSGLYANKIRAIIRELSCNAVDSHVAAGKADTPFDVHLPNTLEPWFSIRDYGTGLTQAQVTNIYTTYFESTKTDSNDFIGALGLGSKSPFSYTDNFTVTAIRDGRKGIYTAFINEHGVPSIALMTESDTDEPAGVEVKFSVNNRYDFDKFISEARIVYKFFKLRPVIHGCNKFTFTEPEYIDKNVIPGVHTTGGSHSYAVMGNICYPMDMPEAEASLGDLRFMLGCGLVIEFAIGELDFQASREGLSYIPSTVNAIKAKLEALNAALTKYVETEADKFTNYWDRAAYLAERYRQPLWRTPVQTYALSTKFPLTDANSAGGYNFVKPFIFRDAELRSKYNIVLRAFTKDRGSDTCKTVNTVSVMDDATRAYVSAWKIYPSNSVYFVTNDTTRGVFERTKFHWRKTPQAEYNETVYVIDAHDKDRKVNIAGFMKDMYNPPRVLKASTLKEKERLSNGANWNKASILRLEKRRRSAYDESFIWANAGAAGDFDKSNTYYYVEMKGWEAIDLPMHDVKNFHTCLNQSGLFTGTVYGVRQRDMEAIKTQKNWVNLNEFVREKLKTTDMNNIKGLVKQAIDLKSLYKHNVVDKVNPNSPYAKLYNEFKDVDASDASKRAGLERMFKAYGIVTNMNVDPNAMIQKYKAEVEIIRQRYSLLSNLEYYADKQAVADYINMVDQVKGI